MDRQLAVDRRLAAELTDRAPILRHFDMQVEQAARFNRRSEFCAVDTHEIDELARVGEVHRFHSQHPGGLRHRFDDQHARHDWARGKMALEKGFVDRHRLDRMDRLVWHQRHHAVDQQHRITMRQRSHDPTDIHRATRVRFNLSVHSCVSATWAPAPGSRAPAQRLRPAPGPAASRLAG